MSEPKLISFDPITGVSSWYQKFPDGTFRVFDHQDVEEIINHNHDVMTTTNGIGPNADAKDMKLVKIGSVPIVIENEMRRNGINPHSEEGFEYLKKRFWNNIDYSKFKSTTMRI